MLLGAIADDFTGASDLANTLSTGGMRTIQFVRVPATDAPPDCEAGVVALKTRSISPDEAVRQSLEAARWLLDQGCRQLFFKYCSTFDSTPHGNIGPVAEALLDLLQTDRVIFCPAFPRVGRRVFMGHLFVDDRLLNESGMEHHPLTPMTDPDIRRWLGSQTKRPVGHLSLDAVRAGAPVISRTIDQLSRSGTALIVADAVNDEDLEALGASLSSHKLITGGSGIALGLPENFRSKNLLDGNRMGPIIPKGPAVVLCGSCSKASQAQVESYRCLAPGLEVNPADLVSGRMTAKDAFVWAHEQKNQNPMVYSTADVSSVTKAQAVNGKAEIAVLIEQFFGDLAEMLAEHGWKRIIVGGGETSGAIVESLGITSMHIGKELAPGVPALLAESSEPIGLVLKSGNFGGVDFFADALTAMDRP